MRIASMFSSLQKARHILFYSQSHLFDTLQEHARKEAERTWIAGTSEHTTIHHIIHTDPNTVALHEKDV